MLLRLLAISMLVAYPLSVFGAEGSADETRMLTESQYFAEIPPVLTATRLAQAPLESPSSITVLRREQIVASGARDVAELLRLAPGFQVAYFKAHRPVVTYHGLSDDFARRLQVLVDGRSVYTPLFGGVLWSGLAVPVEEIQRMEIIRSPNAAAFGPNSFSAIINIITRHAAVDEGNVASVTLGQRGQRDGFARAHGTFGKAHYRISLEHEEDDGFEGRVDSRDLQRLVFRLDRDMGASDQLMVKAGGTLADLGVGNESADPGQAQTNIPRTKEVDTGFLQLEWTRNLDPASSVSFQYSANYDRWTDDTRLDATDGFRFPPADSGLPSYPDPSVRVDLNATAIRHDVELVYKGRLDDRVRVVAGTGARRDSVESRWLFGSGEKQVNDLLRVFGHLEYELLPDTTLHAGALVEDNDLSGTDTSPRIALVQRTAPHHRLRLSLSQATRTPTLFEQRQDRHFLVRSGGMPAFKFFTDFTEEDLQPEQMRAVELGYRIDPPGKRWGMDLKVFREKVEDLLVEVPSDPPGSPAAPGFPDPPPPLPPEPDQNDVATGFVNGFSADLEGVEGSVWLYPAEDIDLRLWGSSTSVTEARAVNESVREEFEASVPQLTAGMQGIYHLSPTRQLSVDYYYYERMSWVDKTGRVDADRLDIQYREELGTGYPGGFVAVRLDNVLGEYAEYDPDNVVDTRVSLQAGIRF